MGERNRSCEENAWEPGTRWRDEVAWKKVS